MLEIYAKSFIHAAKFDADRYAPFSQLPDRYKSEPSRRPILEAIKKMWLKICAASTS